MSHDSLLNCKVQGKYVGIPLTFSAGAWPSKANVLKWYFSLQNEVKSTKKVTVAARPLPQLDGLSPSVPNKPGRILPPIIVIGKVPSAGKGGPNVISVPQSLSVVVSAAYGFNYSGGGWVGGIVAPKFTWINSRDGVDLPKWRSIIKAGGNATTGLTGVRYELSIGAISHLVKWRGRNEPVDSYSGFSHYVSPVVPTYGYSDPLFVSNIDNLALSKLHDKLRNLHTDARLGEAVGEYAQLFRMLGGPLNGLKRGWDAYQRDIAKLEKSYASRAMTYGAYVDALARLWLELVFGWQPLIHDLNDAIASLAGKRAKIKTKISASWRDGKQVSQALTQYTTSNYCVRNVLTLRTLNVTIRYQCGINPQKVPMRSQLGRLGFTPEEFVPTLYAVTPYSWLFDYFTSVNNVIDALCADISFVTWTSKTVRRESVARVSDSPDHAASAALPGRPGATSEGTAGVASVTRVDIERSIPASLVPNPTLKLPGSWKPYANIAALLASKFAKPLANGPLRDAMAAAQRQFNQMNMPRGQPSQNFPLA